MVTIHFYRYEAAKPRLNENCFSFWALRLFPHLVGTRMVIPFQVRARVWYCSLIIQQLLSRTFGLARSWYLPGITLLLWVIKDEIISVNFLRLTSKIWQNLYLEYFYIRYFFWKFLPRDNRARQFYEVWPQKIDGFSVLLFEKFLSSGVFPRVRRTVRVDFMRSDLKKLTD